MSDRYRSLTAAALRQIREACGLSEDEAAKALGLHVKEYQRLEADPDNRANEVMQNFLTVDAPSRGQLFKDFISQIDTKNH